MHTKAGNAVANGFFPTAYGFFHDGVLAHRTKTVTSNPVRLNDCRKWAIVNALQVFGMDKAHNRK
jgi:hypothetical protein